MLSTHLLENYLHFAYIPAELAIYFPSLQARSFANHFQDLLSSSNLFASKKCFTDNFQRSKHDHFFLFKNYLFLQRLHVTKHRRLGCSSWCRITCTGQRRRKN